MTITAIRISFITEYYSSGSSKTINNRISLTKQMAHSVDEQLQYKKIINYKLLTQSELKFSDLSSSISSSCSFSNFSTIATSFSNDEQTLTLRLPDQKLITDYFETVISTDLSIKITKSKNIKQTDITNFFRLLNKTIKRLNV